MKVLIATPVSKTVEERYAHSLFELGVYETRKGNEVDLILRRGPYIHHNRNEFVKKFLGGDWEYLLQIDMDIMFHKDTLEKLLKREKDVVFGMYVMVKEGKPYSTFLKGGKPTGRMGEGLIEIDEAGTGMCLAHRRVFEKIGSHWFDFDAEKESEDIAFCRRVREAGFKLYGDCDIDTIHIKDVLFSNRICS